LNTNKECLLHQMPWISDPELEIKKELLKFWNLHSKNKNNGVTKENKTHTRENIINRVPPEKVLIQLVQSRVN